MSRFAHPAGDRHAAAAIAGALNEERPPVMPADLNALHPAIWPRTAVRVGGALTVGGVDVRDLAREFGTPLYIVDEEDFRSRCRDYRSAFPDGDVHYAGKAFLCREVARWIDQEGLGLDVCTGGELAVALSVGFPPERITMHGNNKSVAELERAVTAGVGRIVIDSFEEIDRLGQIAARYGRRPKVLIRVTVGVEAHTHEFIATAHDDQKFGLSLSSGAAAEAVRRVLARPQLELVGLHSHIGSQITDVGGFEVAARRLAGLLVGIRDEHGVVLPELDLGGGYGIPYVEGDEAPDIKVIADGLREITTTVCRSAGLPVPRLIVEPGRSIAGIAGITLYEVGTVKDVEGLRTYVSVDGGMSDNIRTALYGANYTAVVASRESDAAPMLSRLVGKHCESGDMVIRDLWLPSDVVPGDLIAVAGTGAYCRSLSSNYNYLPRPAVVAVSKGAARVIVRRETEEDLLRGQP
ncbi:diaminopimelate decarboxylase [Thermobispora bispora]|uniref:Diaminopimelate decarboxylase n=1 Tax=Thermobispora bispora (strain ATCC 19993 / DSM 43833 / CBS 139.67 / JCM 10125 / KCTC 9307 / NBRC 14880 / R51) TaxID=469371 RepID=D6Y6N0_THEBD|nr:diaminopimelate decarboxylase [Thermobispora bispora]MBO2472939.1 diaminopimelate decarboxylase [Actinomycetales bacterium]MDI9579219.1 diaminopimelate decarboxylase [Thermobispora sp.]ADG87602.1 diaminopimelate decarboxylase [Thermobispora bispora DSM 43833]MBX6167057.1 diaminopimelate decarboxylase [Thermobispora bispora]QSI47523.1 diaminopimelate decarboxylase [Thermobispora bispora]